MRRLDWLAAAGLTWDQETERFDDGSSQLVRDSIGISLAYEYNIDQKETSLIRDVTFGWSF